MSGNRAVLCRRILQDLSHQFASVTMLWWIICLQLPWLKIKSFMPGASTFRFFISSYSQYIEQCKFDSQLADMLTKRLYWTLKSSRKYWELQAKSWNLWEVTCNSYRTRKIRKNRFNKINIVHALSCEQIEVEGASLFTMISRCSLILTPH